MSTLIALLCFCLQGLKQQVEELLYVAQAPCNAWRWQQPRVALYFPSGQVCVLKLT